MNFRIEDIIPDEYVAKVPTIDNGEKIYNIFEEDKTIVISHEKQSKLLHNFPDNYCLLRESVIKRLLLINESLKKRGLLIKLFEGYRSLRVQQIIYNECYSQHKIKYPKKSSSEIEMLTDLWVANPVKLIPPHATGGSIDLTLMTLDGKELDMGTPLNTVYTASFTYSKDIKLEVKNNRKILIEIMSEHGFYNYPVEWWHWSFGDQFWGAFNKESALYLPLNTIPSEQKTF